MRLRGSVLAAVGPRFVGSMGSGAVSEAVDEALAQIIAAGNHLGEPDQLTALWITCARRRLIDEQRSAAIRHRDAAASDDAAAALPGKVSDDPALLSEDERQGWRIREILSVLRGDQRVWAEAWYDRVLSADRVPSGQPRGLAEALGWSPAKTKSVSRRARMRMAAFIERRVSGVACDEQRALMDALIIASRHDPDVSLDDQRHAMLVHVAGCDDCWAVWHARRRALLGRCMAGLLAPIDGLAIAAQTFGAKVVGAAASIHSQSHALLARIGIGSAAAAGGSAATIGGKATAVCVGVVCAATAGGELAGVLPPILLDQPSKGATVTERPKRVVKAPGSQLRTARRTATHVTPAAVVKQPAESTQPAKASVARRMTTRKPTETATPGDLPATSAADSGSPRSATTAPRPTPSAATPAAGATSSNFSTTDSTTDSTDRATKPAAPNAPASPCVPGSLGC